MLQSESRLQYRSLIWLVLGLLTVVPIAGAMAAPLRTSAEVIIRIPGGAPGIGFDDIGYIPQLGLVSIPAGGTGKLVLIDPVTSAIRSMLQVTASAAVVGRHDVGTTSATYGGGYLFASDHTHTEVVVFNAHDGKVVARVPLAGDPDYVRYLESQRELWVTEPRASEIQVFRVISGRAPVVTLETTIPVPGGPESLVFDAALDRGYTNLWKRKTVVLDLKSHQAVGSWDNSCRGPRGLALDARAGFLFVGCNEGKVVVLDLHRNGKRIAMTKSGAGIDIISYNPRFRHLYVPGARSGTMTIFKVLASGRLQRWAVYRTAKGAHCVTNDARDLVWVCDPRAGSILEFRDH